MTSPDLLLENLTRTETVVLTLVAQGKSTKQIAVERGSSAHTIKTHIASSIRKLDATSRWAAVVVAAERGWIEPIGGGAT